MEELHAEKRRYKVPSKVIETNVNLLTSREILGLQKYGHTLDRTDLSHKDLLQHGLEEALDLANYLQAAMQRDMVYEKAYKDLLQRMDKIIGENAFNGVTSSTDVIKKIMSAITDHKFRYPSL